MSVVVFNTHNNKMYADTVTTLGNCPVYKVSKVRHAYIAKRNWQIMIGCIGVPAQFEPAVHYAVTILKQLSEHHHLDELQGDDVLPLFIKDFDVHTQWLETTVKQSGTSPDWSLLIAVRDEDTNEVALGVMDNSLSISWGIRPFTRDVVLGSELISASYLNLDDKLTVVEKLEAVKSVNYVSTQNNSVEVHSFDKGRICEQQLGG